MLGVEIIPAALSSFLSVRLPRSPSWLVANRNDYEEARVVFTQTDPDNIGRIV